MKEIEWSYLGTWYTPMLTQMLFAHYHYPKVISALGLPQMTGGYKVVNYDVYLDKRDWLAVENFFYSKMVKKDFAYLLDFIARAKSAAKKFLDASYDFSSVKSFQFFVGNVHEMMCYWLLVHMIDVGVEKALMERCQAEKVEIYQAMAQIKPTGLTFLERDKKLVRLVKLYKENKLQDSEVEKFVNEFAWLNVLVFSGDPLSKEKLLDELKTFQPLPKANMRALALGWPELKVAEELAFLRYHFIESLNRVSFKFRPLLREIAEKHELTYEEFIWSTCDEVIQGHIQSKQVLNQRASKSVLIVVPPEEKFLVGKELELELQKYSEVVKAVAKLHGMPASAGKAVGKVRVIREVADVSKVERGEVLVASETTPDFLPAMRIAVAIITDQGGVTSHAAIVSRELGVPCVIGTKIATKVLKDGDKVEVDAVKGTVRKLA